MKFLNNLLRVSVYEYRHILCSLPVLLVMGGGIILYGFLYNYMYRPNVLENVPVVVVDKSSTPLSRKYIRMLDATPQVCVDAIVTDIIEARHRVKTSQVLGLVFLPHDFDAKFGRGEASVFVSYNTTVSFLYYAALKEAFSGAMLALDEDVRFHQAVFLNTDVVQPIANTRSVGVQGIALSNENGGYATYLIPGVLMVIIFQTLLMVISMRCGTEYEHRMLPLLPFTGGETTLWKAMSIVIGKTIVYVGFYALFAVFLLGLLPLVFGLPHRADSLLLIQLMIPYLFATSFFGLACSPFFKDSEAPLLLIAFFSVGLLFLSGISWPLELMPWPWRLLHFLIPAPVGVLAFVKADSMGANLVEISREMNLLWLQCMVYFVVACWVYRSYLIKYPYSNQVNK